jgi:universal stress protein A
MFQRILVPTDFSKKSKKALDIAVNIASRKKGVIYLLHVIEIISDTTFEEFKDFYNNLEKRAEKHMDAILTQRQESRTDIRCDIVYGKRTQEILKFVIDNKIDLIIMPSHKLDMKDLSQGWGTISYKIGILSPCPVMLIK